MPVFESLNYELKFECGNNYSRSLLSRLRSFRDTVLQTEFAPILDTVCAWGRGCDVMDLVCDWLEECYSKNVSDSVRIFWITISLAFSPCF